MAREVSIFIVLSYFCLSFGLKEKFLEEIKGLPPRPSLPLGRGLCASMKKNSCRACFVIEGTFHFSLFTFHTFVRGLKRQRLPNKPQDETYKRVRNNLTLMYFREIQSKWNLWMVSSLSSRVEWPTRNGSFWQSLKFVSLSLSLLSWKISRFFGFINSFLNLS